MNIAKELNYENFKQRNKDLEKTNRQLLRLIIKNSPREIVIDELKKLKILKTDLNLKTNKLELMERECSHNYGKVKAWVD